MGGFGAMRIWAKNMVDNKIINDYIYTSSGDFDIHSFPEYITKKRKKLDIPTPIILVKHIKNFILFNSTYFSGDEFVESYPYDKFEISLINN